jgi:hypothetical protein
MNLKIDSTFKKTADNSSSIGKAVPSNPSVPRIKVTPTKVTQPRLNPKPFNDSMFSRMSELHSDGSILRRNNNRFGVKLKQKQDM